MIFYDQLRNGRPAPSYDRSTDYNVTVVLPSGKADLDFVRLIVEERWFSNCLRQPSAVLERPELVRGFGKWAAPTSQNRECWIMCPSMGVSPVEKQRPYAGSRTARRAVCLNDSSGRDAWFGGVRVAARFMCRRPKKMDASDSSSEESTMPLPFDSTYPNIARWVETHGWIEIGENEGRASFIRALDEGGLVWEGKREYKARHYHAH